MRTERRSTVRKQLVKHQNSLQQVNSTLALGTYGSDLYIKTVDEISSYIGVLTSNDQGDEKSDIK